MEQRQEQYQGVERRQSQTQYLGEERRKPSSAARPGMSTQERKDDQEERARQQHENRHDEL